MKLQIVIIFTLLVTATFTSLANEVSLISLENKNLESIEIQKPALFPETVGYNPKNDRFVVGSFREGAIYEIEAKGQYHKIIDNDRLKSSLGIVVDAQRNRLLVATSDIGASIRAYAGGTRKLASVEIFELSSGKHLISADLGKLKPNGAHLANGMAMDALGNIYVTDSFSPVIYKVDVNGYATIFLESKRFLGEGINLNGIAYHPDGYLITVKKNEGILFKVPLNNPEGLSEIHSTTKFFGGDGLVFANKKELIVVANRASGHTTETVFSLTSDDNWQSAKVTNSVKFEEVYLTTSVIKDNKIYVIHSNINELVSAPKEQKSQLTHKAIIQQVGVVNH